MKRKPELPFEKKKRIGIVFLSLLTLITFFTLIRSFDKTAWHPVAAGISFLGFLTLLVLVLKSKKPELKAD